MAGLNEAIQAALNGPERKDIKINDHGFNVKPVTRDQHDGELHIWGQISHRLGGRPDDQIFYHIVKKAGAITVTDISVNKGGWQKIAGPTATAIGAYFGVVIPPDAVSDVMQRIAEINPDRWEQACDIIIGAIAVRV